MLGRSNFYRHLSQFVPKHQKPETSDIKKFKSFLTEFNDILVLTGAGVSTESGIPDYRSEDVGVFARSSYKPILYSEFVKNSAARSRYWARNFIGWPKFSSFLPNQVHFFLNELQVLNKVNYIITQNVDGLHSKAGSNDILELHGNAFWVTCIQCKNVISRYDFQTVLKNCNPFMNPSSGELRPDGDVEISEDDLKNFKVPPCEKCGGILKPTVVFFGENIPQKTVKKADELVEECDSMLILGTSLSTHSTTRLIKKACDSCKFLFSVNIGPTQCDKYINIKVNAKISDVIIGDRKIY